MNAPGTPPACPECGYAYGSTSRREVAATLESFGPAFGRCLEGDRTRLATRPDPVTWSVLEYACHVRDVMVTERDRLYLALVDESPEFPPLHREERVALDRYADQDPPAVGRQLDVALGLCAWAFAGVDDEQWARPLVYRLPDPQRHDVGWLAQHTVHEAVHHLFDMGRILARTPGRRG